MLSTRFHKFLRDESGGYTIWSLIWFSLYVAMGGLAVDMTDAYRNQTMLQSTADASALAGVMSLSDQDDAVAQALAFATDNMNPAINGEVLKAGEVILGNWDFATKTFAPGTTAPNAVRVITRRDDANNNPLATNFLRILGLWGLPMDRWNISVQAIAIRYVPNCIRDGLVAANQVHTNGNNNYINDICIHGQNVDTDPGLDYAIELNNGNDFEPGVQVSMPDLNKMPMNTNTCKNNPGLCSNAVLFEGDVWPADVKYLDAMIQGMQSGSAYMPDYVYITDADGNYMMDGNGNPMVNYEEITNAEKYTGPYLPNTIYDMKCTAGNKTISLPTDTTISNVVIVADCNITSSNGLHLENVVLASSYAGNGPNGLAQSAITLASGTYLGNSDYCGEGGGVQIYSASSVHVAAGGEFHGLRIVAAYDVQFTARNVGVWGMDVQAGHDIFLTSNNDFGLCPGSGEGGYAWQYRLVR